MNVQDEHIKKGVAMRFDRQKMLHEIGELGQEKLRSSSVSVVGAGGLGCPVLTYLSAAGVGSIKIIDFDTVSLSNLNRQFLHGIHDIGKLKAESAFEKLSHTYNDISFSLETRRLDIDTVNSLVGNCNLVVNCVDNIATRLIVNDYCLASNIPLVEGGITGFYGFVMAIKRDTACLRCLGFDALPEQKTVPSIGTTAGVVGSIAANEAIKILLSMPDVLFGKILHYDGLHCDFDLLDVKQNLDCAKTHHNVV